MPKNRIKIGLVDADLLCNGTRHPNLVLMKLAGFFKDNGIEFKLIIDQDEDITPYKYIYVSRVFTFTQMPAFYENAIPEHKDKFREGGTGFLRAYEESPPLRGTPSERGTGLKGRMRLRLLPLDATSKTGRSILIEDWEKVVFLQS